MSISNINTAIGLTVQITESDLGDSTINDPYQWGQGGINAYSPAPAYNASGGSSKIKFFFHHQYSIGTSGTSLTLSDGSLTDRFGNALAFTKIKIVIMRIVTPTTGVYITVGNGSQPWQWRMSTAANTFKLYSIDYSENLIDGFTVNSGDILKFVASAGTVAMDLVLLGE